MYTDIRVERSDGIATITIDRPDVHNAFREETILELNEALRDVANSDEVYVLVLTGASGSFCAGADITEMPDWDKRTKEEYAGYLWRVQNVVRQLRDMSKPSIAAVSGPAVGAGCDFALACDVRVVGQDGFFREGFVRIGLIPGDGGAWLLPRLIGESAAKYYLLTGKDIVATEAVDLGLAIPGDGAVQNAHELAREIRDLPSTAVRRTNNLTDSQLSFEDYCERAIEYQWNCINDAEHKEAVRAFHNGVEPDYERDYN